MKRFTKAAVLGATALAAGLVTTAAQAQVDVITVTAQKREQTLQEVPVAVAVVTGEAVEMAQVRDARDLQFLVPSLEVGQAASSTNQTFTIRSLGTDTFNPGLEASVGVFVDGVFMARQGAAINDFLSLERIEVLRGPQSTLFGRNTPAGVISFVSKAPEFEFGGQGEITFGNFEGRILRATVTGPLVEDRLAFRIDGNRNTRGGFIDNLTDGRELNDRDRWSTRAQLQWEVSDNTQVRFIADYSEIDEQCCAAPFFFYAPASLGAIPALGGTLLPPDPWNYQIAIDNPVFTRNRNSGVSAQIDHQFDGFTFTSITAFRNYFENQNIDADFTDLDLAGDRLITQRYDTFTQEVRLTSDGGGDFDWLLGGFYYDNTLRHNNQTPYGSQLRAFADALTGGAITAVENLVGAPPGLFLAQGQGLREEDYVYNTQSWSVFGQVDYHVTDRLTVTGGLRYTRETKDIVANIDIFDPWSAINLVDLGEQVIFAQAFQLQTGLAPTPANIGFFAANFPAQFAALQAFAAAGSTNPAVNPFLALTPLQFNPPAPGFTDDRSEDNISGNLILAYQLSENTNLYASYSRGFKAGGFNVSANAALTGVFEFEPEISTSIEFGAKALIFDNTTQVNIALFRQNLEDFQANIFTGSGFGLQNAGEVQLTGLEFEFFSRPFERLALSGGFTYMFESVFKSFDSNSCYPSQAVVAGIFPTPGDVPAGQCGRSLNAVTGLPVTTQNSTGQDRQTPELTAVFSAMYTQPLSDTLEGFIRADYSHTSERTLAGNFNPQRAVGAVDLVNASVGFGATDGAWQMQFWVRNLLEEEYQQGNFESVGQPGSINVYPGDPRTYGLTLRARF